MPARSSAFRARLRWRLVAGLRSWAEGSLSDQAAVELLVSCSNGRFVRPGYAWIRPCARPGWYWLDAEALADYAATRVGEERQVLTLTAQLVNGDQRSHHNVSESRRAAA